jgi:branched-chain amino acid transport system permease protein
LIFKTSYTTNFAQGVISAIGAYVAVELVYDWGVPIWMVALAGVVVAFIIGVVIDVVIFRNGRYVNALGKQIITMGLISIIIGLIPFVFKVSHMESVPTFPFVHLAEGITVGGVFIQYNTMISCAVTAVLLAIVFTLLQKSKWGLSVRSTASNEIVAGMMGINTKIITAISWGIAGAFGAVAAIIYIGNVTLASGYIMTTTQINAFLAGILGGFATFYGPILGAAIIYALDVLVGCVCIHISGLSTWKSAIVYLVVMLLVLWKPQGLFGKRMVKKV